MTVQVMDFLFSAFFLLLILLEGTAYPAAVLTAALLHEAGHAAAAFLFGIPIQKIRFSITGIRMDLAFFKGSSYSAELIIAASGPVCNFLCAVWVFTAVHFNVLPPSPQIFFFAVCCLFYAVFNLFPSDSLDGGSIVRSVCGILNIPGIGEKILGVGEILSVLFLWIFAVYAQLVLNGNFSVLILSVFCLFKTVFAKNAVTIT